MKPNLQNDIRMTKHSFDRNYWNIRWKNKETGWDIGYAAPAITEFMTGYPDKKATILIPGCGNAYEATFLIENGFSNITLLDISSEAIEVLKEKFAKKAGIEILCEDFFYHERKYDLIIEQTFFCAISPERRKEYAAKAASLLKKNGKVMGLLFNRTFEEPGPPFGGSKKEYISIFEPFFEIKTMTECNNSILPRAGSELFINLAKRPSITNN